MDVQIEPGWKEALKPEFEKPYFAEIVRYLRAEKSLNKVIYPPGPLIFNAFQQTPFDTVKVVLIGQDPYHNPAQAQGLCFSVPDNIPPPPSLLNIYKELKADLGIDIARKGNLQNWAGQGVLLLNASLTVRKNEPASHSKIGWENFTDAVIHTISRQKQGIVFLLWGRFAREKQKLIDITRHHVLTAAHPSPLSASNGFLGCRHFSKTNDLLIKQGMAPIDWKIQN